MTREEKSQVIKELTTQLADNANIYLTDISGLDALATSNLRRACFKAGIQLAVVKNTLLEKKMTSCKVGSLFMYTTSQPQYTQARKVKKRALALLSANRRRARPALYSSNARAAAYSTVHSSKEKPGL